MFAIQCSGGLIQFYDANSLCRLDDVTLPCKTADIQFDNEGLRLFAIGGQYKLALVIKVFQISRTILPRP